MPIIESLQGSNKLFLSWCLSTNTIRISCEGALQCRFPLEILAALILLPTEIHVLPVATNSNVQIFGIVGVQLKDDA